MSVPSSVVREMAGEVRCFRSPREAILWYIAQKARRSLRSVPLESGSGRPPQEHVNQVHATYAKLALCIERQHDEADLDDEFLLFGRRVAHLATWYVSSAERGQQSLADEMGFTAAELAKYCLLTELVIRRRMQARGLLW
jgi:hypothetical protein